MNDKEFEEIVLNSLDNEDNENNEDDENDSDDHLNNAFKEYIVKKIKPEKELIQSFDFDDISYIYLDNAFDVYANSYSTTDSIKYKFCGGHLSTVSTICLYNFNIQSFVDCLYKFFDHIPNKSYIKNLSKSNGKLKIDDFYLALRDGRNERILIYAEYESCTIFYNKQQDNKDNLTLIKLLGFLENFVQPKINKNKIFVVHKTQRGFDKTGFTIKKININLEENYNDDFQKVAKDIISGLNKKNKTNLVILSGISGSGKTTFIRYMASRLKKNIIFISPDMVNYITDPSFIPFLIKNNDSILIIEDAEPALETRDSGRTGAVSNILNLTDGLLSDCLNISIVATFNTESNKIDSALLRKGRLLKNYKFEKLSTEKSSALLKKLGHDVNITEPMSLSDIYYYADNNNAPENIAHKVVGGFRK